MNPIVGPDPASKLADARSLSATDRKKLKRACQDFEAVLVGKMMKDSFALSRRISRGGNDTRPFAPLEDLTVEMAAERICESGGVGLWKMLYEQVSKQNGKSGD